MVGAYELNGRNKSVYILGDFNVDLLHHETHQHTSDFLNTMFLSSFIPLINHPTRVTESSATLIDNIFTNCHDTPEIINGILLTDISDHFSIFSVIYDCNGILDTQQLTPQYRHLINETTMSNFKLKLQQIDWGNVFECTDAQTAYQKFFKTFNNVYHENCPLKKVSQQTETPKKPWISKALLACIKTKNNMNKRLTVNADESMINYYKKYKN